MAEMTPMMRQYLETKEKYPGMILFFRLGDFYEMFFDDAKLVSKELDLTLTGKSCGLDERAPMCGVPFHSADTYINLLIEKGYKVAICEQMEDPSTVKGLVKREVVRVVTPGTVIDSSMLEDNKNNFILSLCIDNNRSGIAFCDVSTGEFYVYEIKQFTTHINDELHRINPREIISNSPLPENIVSFPYTIENKQWFLKSKAVNALTSHFKVHSANSLDISDLTLGIRASGALIQYLESTQKNALSHITQISRYYSDHFLVLDYTTRKNLELTETIRSHSRKDSLLDVLDYTCTSMGSRQLRNYIEQPLCVQSDIDERLEAISCLQKNDLSVDALRSELGDVYDIERLLSKIAYRTIGPRDCLALLASLSHVPSINKHIKEMKPAGALLSLDFDENGLLEIVHFLTSAIDPDSPALLNEGHYIRRGFNEDLDTLRDASSKGRIWISDMETSEREKTGIKNLRIQYNRVFGYYIEVTKSFLNLVPDNYTRKQTLSNSERFTTPQLHQIEQTILGAQERALRLEQSIFNDIRDYLLSKIPLIQQTAIHLKTLDALISLSVAATRHHYVRPVIDNSGRIEIEEGRHPVVENSMTVGNLFVPNDTILDCDENRMLIITGPNMAGKSTYMRQIALIVLMAHIGSFVPASSARIGLVDRIFTRIGASDDLASGQSTFMVEMSEMANILKNATAHSLILLDEIGRGTSTFDGLSIAWSVVEYIANKSHIAAKTLFATHYHELSELEGHIQGVVNYRVKVKEHGEDIIFLRKIERGSADKSFGIHVAHIAGLPRPVIMRAHEILARIEANDLTQERIGAEILGNSITKPKQMNLFDTPAMDLVEELRKIDVLSMTPIDALTTLFTFKEKARLI